jgi:hypothetical protein
MDITNEEDYTKGFNEGYLIASKLPELAQNLKSAKLDDDRGRGLQAGVEQFEQEKLIDKDIAQSYLDRARERPHSKDKGKELDKD